VHVDAARALLALLPLLSKKSRPGTIRGPLRDAFLRSAAMLLNVHGMYGETITRLHLTIAPQRCAHFYNPSEFADESHLNCEHVARFLASVGVTMAEAETWRQWAAAYVDMSLTEHPEDALLQDAMRDARARIDADHSLVVTILTPYPNFPPFILRSRSLVLHSFPHAPLGPSPNHLTSHLIDHMTNPQSTITCHHSAVRSIMTCPHLTLFSLPAHDAPLRSCQLMMELYLELPRHDFTLVIFPYFFVTSVTRYFSNVYKHLYF